MKDEIYLVDTSIWLEVLPEGDVSLQLRHRIDGLLTADLVAIIGVVRLELLGGARTEAEYQRLGRLLSALHLLPIAEERWDEAARLGFELRRRGIAIPFANLLIAAIAMHADAVLVHHDHHFDTIAAHHPLKVESYVLA